VLTGLDAGEKFSLSFTFSHGENLLKGELYKDPRVQALLSKSFSGKLQVIFPVFNLERGIFYPDVEDVLGGCLEAGEFLAELYNAGFLSRKLYDKVVCCPSCGSVNVSTRYSCPYCKSFDIIKSSLIEHIKCGCMDVEEKFRLEGKLVCPKCHGELTKRDVDYRRAGVWCTCRGCGKSFDMPVAGHFCRECRHVFLFEDAVFKEAYVYKLNEAVKTEFLVGAIPSQVFIVIFSFKFTLLFAASL